MKKPLQFCLTSTLLYLTCSPAKADLIIFNLGRSLDGNTAIDGQTSGSLTVGGLTALLKANNGTLNATTTNFGINTFDIVDLTDELDGPTEFITITFNQPVRFTQLTLDSLAGTETANLKIGLNAPLTLADAGSSIDIYNFSSSDLPLGNTITMDQSAVIAWGSGNGFSLEGFQVTTVPEPTTCWTALAATAGLMNRRRRSC